MILNKAVIEELKEIKVREGEGDIDKKIAYVLNKHNIEFTAVINNFPNLEVYRVYREYEIIIIITIGFITKMENGSETYFFHLDKIEEL